MSKKFYFYAQRFSINSICLDASSQVARLSQNLVRLAEDAPAKRHKISIMSTSSQLISKNSLKMLCVETLQALQFNFHILFRKSLDLLLSSNKIYRSQEKKKDFMTTIELPLFRVCIKKYLIDLIIFFFFLSDTFIFNLCASRPKMNLDEYLATGARSI